MRVLFGLLFLSLSFQIAHAEYQPVNEGYWDAVTRTWRSQNWTGALQGANSRWLKTKEGSLERAEAQLSSGMTLRKMGLVFSAQMILSELVQTFQGTNVGWQALRELDEMVRTDPIDAELVIRSLVMELDLDSPPEDVADFVYFNRGLRNRDAGFKKWSDEDLKKLKPESYWGYRMQYQEALKKVAEKKDEEAYQIFLAFTTKEGVPKDIQQESWHQLARIEFERANYEKAYEIFEKVEIRPRERGAILLERAWSKFYLRDYPKALGLLTALEAPVFETSRSPEAYLLKMLIYKELCYFDSVFDSLSEFNVRFKSSIDMIKKRGDFSQSKALTLLAIVDRKAQVTVDAFNQARKERAQFAELGLKKYTGLRSLERAYVLQIRRLKEDIDYAMHDSLKVAAERLLDWFEQISFLDYQTRIDQLRMTKLRYSRADLLTPMRDKNKVFWIFAGEFWKDEIEDIRVDVTNQCGGNLGR